MPANGLVVMPPTSIAYSGTSASINTDKSVTFTSVTTLSLNGVFTSSYDNYMVTMRFTNTAFDYIQYRLRLSGTDNSTASSYVYQSLNASGLGTPSGSRSTNNQGRLAVGNSTQREGLTLFMFGPSMAQPTAARTITVDDRSSAGIWDHASTHNQSTAYDGLTIFPASGNMSGLLTVFGFNN